MNRRSFTYTVSCIVAVTSLFQAAAAYPAVETGTHELVSSSDPNWTYDRYTQYPNGTFTGYGNGTWGELGEVNKYTYWGDVDQYSCTTHSNGDVVLMINYWYHDDENHEEGQKQITCSYKSFSQDGIGNSVVFRQPTAVDMSFPSGECPATAEAAERDGIDWMETDRSESTFRCVKDCQPLNCAEFKESPPAPPPAPPPTAESSKSSPDSQRAAPPPDGSAAQKLVPGNMIITTLLVTALTVLSASTPAN
mmetsp:Transcript_35733/g.43129  ORF Transcript_35733/g.43129 Transcript_35733/m.43129 type:complete len:250 (+) Transcript_35733:232-981(+)|eukprot:CAMPEP_0197851366 /NCGR_PEP_ID=MMETSP1438-20131217/17892_1 /TAXON_ID=1461541 /ORGANISM="Pterosperma sp., Strain CCMP1384" /LENGTH=249 /DNA_ID=CAMNT_0043464943 /DNA_START=232 /DNA_END=981 /DNA_ORIENTATION=-